MMVINNSFYLVIIIKWDHWKVIIKYPTNIDRDYILL